MIIVRVPEDTWRELVAGFVYQGLNDYGLHLHDMFSSHVPIGKCTCFTCEHYSKCVTPAEICHVVLHQLLPCGNHACMGNNRMNW